MKKLALVLLLGLSACSTTRYAPVHCLTPEQLQRLKDAEPERVGDKLTGQAQDDFKIVAGSAVRLRLYARGLLGTLEGCTSGPDRSR